MVLLSVVQVNSSLTALGDFMVLLFLPHPQEVWFGFLTFFFLGVYYAGDLSVEIQGHKGGTLELSKTPCRCKSSSFGVRLQNLDLHRGRCIP